MGKPNSAAFRKSFLDAQYREMTKDEKKKFTVKIWKQLDLLGISACNKERLSY